MTDTLRRHRWLALLLAVLVLAGACGRDEGDDDASGGDDTTEDSDDSSEEMAEPSPGITEDTVKIGATYPLSGPASAYAVISEGLDACFDEINANGGIEMADGTREIEFIVKDDTYLPDQAVANARALVEQDEVFMILNPLGTANNAAIREYMNEEEVPQAFVASGASMWGAQHDEFGWTTGWQPSYPTESSIYAEFLQQEFPDGATVAILFQNDSYGEDYVGGFEAAIEGSNIEIIARESYEATDPTVDSQIVNLAQSGADVFFNVTTPTAAAQAVRAVGESTWEPLHLLNSVSNSKVGVLEPAGLENAAGVYTTLYLKDPSDAQWDDDEAMMEYFASAEEYGDFEPLNGFGVFGYSVCDTVTKVLQDMPEPTREAFQETADNMEYELPLALPGISVNTGEGDAFPIEAMQIAQFNNETWELQGDVLDFEGETPVPGE